LPRDAFGLDAGVGFIEGADLDLRDGAEDAALFAIKGEAVEHSQRIGWNCGTEPLDDVAIVVIVRGLDQHQRESLWGARTHLRLSKIGIELGRRISRDEIYAES